MTFLSLLGPVAARDAFADATGGGRIADWRIQRDIRRFKCVATDRVMDLLAIRSGMTILDIGAGTGQFAYEYSRRLNGTGSVYAADTNASCVDYMRGEAERRGLRNLHPVLVAKDGVDAFYGTHRYDLITVFHVLMPYEDRVDYFRELRADLREGGRLILILYKIPTPFSPGDFTGNFRELIDALSREPEGSPFYGVLKDSTRRWVRQHPDAESAGALKTAVVDGFNEMLSDNRFAARFLNGPGSREEARFLPEERAYADWLLQPFRDTGVRNRTPGVREAPGGGTAATVNKLLIMQRYRKHLKTDGLFVSGFTPAVKAAFETAGYGIDGEYPDVIPFEDVIVLSPR